MDDLLLMRFCWVLYIWYKKAQICYIGYEQNQYWVAKGRYAKLIAEHCSNQ